MADLQHNAITNDPLLLNLHGLHLPGYSVANSTARGAITTANAGDLCYQQDTNVYYVYNGSTWTAIATSSGFTGLIANTTELSYETGTTTSSLLVEDSGSALLCLNAVTIQAGTNISIQANASHTLTLLGGGGSSFELANTGEVFVTSAGETNVTATGNLALNGNNIIIDSAEFTTFTSQLNIDNAVFYTPCSLGNFASGGVIGTAGATVGTFTCINIAQTTAGQTLTLPDPGSLLSEVVYICNTGSTSFTMYGKTIGTSNFSTFVWSGSAWLSQV